VSRRRVLVVAHDQVGRRMAGPAIRSWEFARHLAREHDVTLSVPAECDLPHDEFALVVADPSDHRAVWPLVRDHDVVVAQFLPPETMLKAARSPVRTIYDLYDPFHLENLARELPRTSVGRLNARVTELALELALRTGDSFLCASEKQRDLWLGALGALARLDRDRYARDPSFREFVAVVPFGIQSERPKPGPPRLKGVLPGVGATDRVLLWGGGLWDWLDPLTPIRATAKLLEHRDDIRLVFLGVRHPNPLVRETDMTRRAMQLAEELGVRERGVVFNEGWVPYDERGSFLLEADIGISAHPDTVEARFAFRTRIVDYLWAALPVIATEGDDLAELVSARAVGSTVAAGDVEGWARAIERLLEPAANAAARARAEEVRGEFEWPHVLEPLGRLAAQPAGRSEVGAAARLLFAEYLGLRARLSHEHRGTFGMAAHAVSHAGRVVRRVSGAGR
jgi:glycosyltransferase involved in cell wall biosynthesis